MWRLLIILLAVTTQAQVHSLTLRDPAILPTNVFSSSTLNNQLEAYWKLDESSGTRNDSHGANHLTENGTVTATTGKIGNSAVFLATGDESLSIADNAALSFGDEDMSLDGWIKLTALDTTSFVVSKDNGTLREYLLYFSHVADKLSFYVSGDGTASSFVQADTFGAFSAGVWYYFYVEHDATANTIKISINGGTKDSASHSAGILNGTAPFRMGCDAAGTSDFDGELDEVEVHRRKLTDAEIAERYNSGNGRTY